MSERVLDGLEAAALGGQFHAEGLVRPLFVEIGDEVVEPGLLLEAVFGGRPGGFFLQGQMHALEAAVLLRAAGLNALDGDAQAQPPDGEARQAVKRVRAGEGDAELPERPLEDAEGVNSLGG